jgi:uncharacterized membrane protein
MSYDDSDSRRISPAALVLVVIVAALIGLVWWMNSYGAGGAPQPAQTKSLTPEEIQNMSHKLAEERQKQLEKQFK